MIPGKEVEIGGTKYTLPPLNIPSLRKHEEFLNKGPSFGAGKLIPTATDILEMTEIVRESFMRNYAEVDFATVVEPNLDVPKVSECFGAIMTANAAGPATGESKPASA